jgi:non-lysosomal glucosylceramidase
MEKSKPGIARFPTKLSNNVNYFRYFYLAKRFKEVWMMSYIRIRRTSRTRSIFSINQRVSALLLTFVLAIFIVPVFPIPEASSATSSYWGFETGTLEGWKVVSTPNNFGVLITDKTYFNNKPTLPVNKEGTYFLSTLEASGGGISDSSGVIVSPQFTLTHPKVSMLVGGGNTPGEYVAACVYDTAEAYNCREVAKAQGVIGVEHFQYQTMDLSSFIGESMFIKVVDNPGWEYITVDNVRVNAPSMPQGLKVNRSGSAVTIEWLPVSEPLVSGYNVYRSKSAAGSYTKLNASVISYPSYVDTTGTGSSAYYYRVSAVGSDEAESELNITYARPFVDLNARGSTRTYSGSQLSGIEFPVGPIGAGGIRHFGTGERNLGWIFNSDDTFRPRTQGKVPNSFFAVRAQPAGGTAVIRALQTTAEGSFSAMQSLDFQGEYPIARYNFHDSALPITVTQEIFNPMIPGNLKDSAIPTAIYTMTFTNTSASQVSVSLLATQQNVVGFDGVGTISGTNNRSFIGYGSNANTIINAKGIAHLQMTGATGQGNMVLSMLGSNLGSTASWTTNSELASAFAANGTLTGPTTAGSPSSGVTVDGALSNTITLNAGATSQMKVILSWYFPSNPARGFGGEGMQYTNYWTSATDVDQYVNKNLAALQSQTQLYHDTMYDSTLPQYILDRITSAAAVLHTPTVFWASNGFFGGWEGYGCCINMPNHVWQYAQTQALLWPELGRKIDQQYLDDQLDEGLLPYRYNVNEFSFDGQTGVILSSYRDYLYSQDTSWLIAYWPKIRKAMDYVVDHFDPGQNGILQGDALTTLDSTQATNGSWLGSMYLAAVNASTRMASAAGDTASATRYQNIYNLGRVKQEDMMWNGQYYIDNPQNAEGASASNGNAVDINMLLGQWWSTQLGMGDIYNSQHMTLALQNLYKYNYKDNFLGDSPYTSFLYTHAWRVYVEPTDAALIEQTWPNNDRPTNPNMYNDESWSGTQYAAASLLISRGLTKEGMTVVKANSDQYDGRLRNSPYLVSGACGNGDGGGNPFGDDECGKWYARSLSVGSVLGAMQGYTYDAPNQSIGFSPKWQPENHRSFFTSANGWGTFDQQRSRGVQTDTLSIAYGSLSLQKLNIDIPSSSSTTGWTIMKNGVKLVGSTVKVNGTTATATFASTTLSAGDTITIQGPLKPGKPVWFIWVIVGVLMLIAVAIVLMFATKPGRRLLSNCSENGSVRQN